MAKLPWGLKVKNTAFEEDGIYYVTITASKPRMMWELVRLAVKIMRGKYYKGEE